MKANYLPHLAGRVFGVPLLIQPQKLSVILQAIGPRLGLPPGEFEIEGLAPGDYFIAAWEEIPSGLVEDTSFLGRFQTAMTSATLESNGHASAVVKLIPREKMNAEIEKLR